MKKVGAVKIALWGVAEGNINNATERGNANTFYGKIDGVHSTQRTMTSSWKIMENEAWNEVIQWKKNLEQIVLLEAFAGSLVNTEKQPTHS